ncbi:synaptic vesicle 2-related protein-like [Babylonia areolata]|uniref:synaptic vesicle 2-related protein-like n=1 Tax=Babylonia areolata TaxID=304850 RepID=UPI003FD1D0A8
MPLQYGSDGDRAPRPHAYTVEDAIERVGFGWLQLRVYVVCKLIVATDAMEIMLLSLVGPVVQCEWQLPESEVAFISTAVFFGMMVASPVLGVLADHYGRRTCLLFSTLWTAYFGFLTSFAPSYYWLLLLRGLVGIGMGGVPQGYALIAEYVPSKFRAKMIVFGEMFWASGSLFVIMLAALVMPSLGWRWLVGISSLPVFLATLACLFVPESARYQVAAGRTEDALAVLERVAAVNKRSLPHGSLKASNKVPLASIRDLFSPEYLRSTLLLWPFWFVVSLAYYGIVLASPYLLSDQEDGSGSCMCHILSSGDYIALATSTVGEVVGLLFSVLLIDRVGRRWTGRLLMLAAAAFLFLLQVPGRDQVFTTFLIFGVRGATLTAFNLCFIYTVELYPTNMRAVGLGVCTGWGRLASMITPFLAQMLMVFSVPITVTIYGVMCCLAALCMCFMPIETMGRPMMQSISYAAEGDSEESENMADARVDE